MSYKQDAIDTRASLAESGGDVAVSWSVTPDYVPGAPDPVPVVTSYTAPGVIAEYGAQQVGVQTDSLIQKGDRNLLMAACDEVGEPLPAPPFGAQVTLLDGSLYKVANCKAIQPDGFTNVLFDITLRR